MAHFICHTDHFSSLIFQQVHNIYIRHLGMAEELKRSGVSVGAGTRTYLKSTVIWLTFSIGEPSVMLHSVWLVIVERAHHCCLHRAKKPTSSTFISLLSLIIDKGAPRITLE